MSAVISAKEWIAYASDKLIACNQKLNAKNCVLKINTEILVSENTALNINAFENANVVDNSSNSNANVGDNSSNSNANDGLGHNNLSSSARLGCDDTLFFTSGIMNSEEAKREASIIFCHCIGIDKIQLRLREKFDVTEEQLLLLEAYLERRASGEPLAYIFGYKEFFGIDFMVNQHTLIPRPETEFLVEEALSFEANEFCLFLDLGCGSGCIALSVLQNRPQAHAILVDISPEALAVARENAFRLGVGNRAHFILGDFTCASFKEKLMSVCKDLSCLNANNKDNHLRKNAFFRDESSRESSYDFSRDSSRESSYDFSKNNNGLDTIQSDKTQLHEIQFDMIISNPPYIPIDEYNKLHTSVKDYEPQTALVSQDIIDDIENIQDIKNTRDTKNTRDVELKDLNLSVQNHDSSFAKKGLFHAYAVIHLAQEMLKPCGLLLIEHGYNQAQDCRDLCDKQKWRLVTSGKDYGDIERYLKAFRAE